MFSYLIVTEIDSLRVDGTEAAWDAYRKAEKKAEALRSVILFFDAVSLELILSADFRNPQPHIVYHR